MQLKTKTKMRATSLTAFYDILNDLGKKELEVLLTIKQIQPCSDKMIAKRLNWSINRVTGRRNDLAKVKAIRLYKKDSDQEPPFKKVCYWFIPSYNNDILLNSSEIK